MVETVNTSPCFMNYFSIKVLLSFIVLYFGILSHNQVSQRGFSAKNVEDPVIVLSEKNNVDIIGPPDPESNLRPIVRRQVQGETKLQCQLRELQAATERWNHDFWRNHNRSFLKQRDDYVKKQNVEGKYQLSSDEMSDFYKQFLDRNWELHLKYNFEWYKKNFALLVLSFKANLERSLIKLKSHMK